MQITLNGIPKELEDINTVADLLATLDLNGRLAVEINHEIVPRSMFKKFRVNAGDAVEIVHAIGGG